MENTQSDEAKQQISSFEKGYKDRKMAKWQGFILSDHSDLIRQEKKLQIEPLAKEKQSLSVISDCLHRSFAYGHQLSIQLDFIVDGSYEPDITGIITGFENQLIYVQSGEESVVIDLSLIRHVELLRSSKWFAPDSTT